MDFHAYFKHMDTSLALYAYAEDKLSGRVEKHPLRAAKIDVTFSLDGRLFVTHCHVTTKHASFDVTASDEQSMYAAVDLAADKLDVQLRRYKEKIRSHRGVDLVPAQPASPEASDAEAIDAAEVINFERARSRTRSRSANAN